ATAHQNVPSWGAYQQSVVKENVAGHRDVVQKRPVRTVSMKSVAGLIEDDVVGDPLAAVLILHVDTMIMVAQAVVVNQAAVDLGIAVLAPCCNPLTGEIVDHKVD